MNISASNRGESDAAQEKCATRDRSSIRRIGRVRRKGLVSRKHGHVLREIRFTNYGAQK